MLQRTVKIFERDDYWWILGPEAPNAPMAEFRRKTAVAALRLIKDQDRRLGKNAITVIEWYPVTTIGKIIVEALQ